LVGYFRMFYYRSANTATLNQIFHDANTNYNSCIFFVSGFSGDELRAYKCLHGYYAERGSPYKEVYKTVDTFKLKIDIFYTNMTSGRENNTAIVFFHGGGWAYGTPDEFFTTCERYAKMGIVTFSVDYRLSVDNGIRPSKTISPIESVMDARSAMRWVRENAGKYYIGRDRIVAAGQSAGGHLHYLRR